ncbi:hypothetical protein [Bradyrhizobium sp. USDA 4474]
MTQALERARQAARQRKKESSPHSSTTSASTHHISIDCLRKTASAGGCGARGQDRPDSDRGCAERHLQEDFLGFSYGFRPKRGQHNALDALVVGITSRRVNFIFDADVASFFDSVSKDWLMRFVGHRIGDSAHYTPDPEVVEGWCP